MRVAPPELVQELLNGEGAGSALTGELNHYPGPAHALQMRQQLRLTAEQEAAIERLAEEMTRDAKTLGKRLVGLERQLDRESRAERIGDKELRELTEEITDRVGRRLTVRCDKRART